MRRVKRILKLAVCMLLGVGMLTEGSLLKTYATETVPIDWLEEPDAQDEEELNQMIDEYLIQMGNGDPNMEDIISETIENPELILEAAERGKVKYTLPNKSSFTVTVPNGMITTQVVEFEFAAGAMVVARKNDEDAVIVDVPRFTEPGVYQLKMIFYQSPSQTAADYNVYEVNYDFMIIAPVDNTLGVVTAPKDFRITEAKKDGVALEVLRADTVFLQDDGIYEIRYQDLKNGRMHFSTTFERDTTAPFLTFSKEITDGAVAGPIEYYPSEIDCSVVMTYEGNRGPAVSNVLNAGGFYQLEVTDQAGNSRFYQLTVRQTYQFWDKRLVILTLIFLGAIGLRLLFLRREMKVI